MTRIRSFFLVFIALFISVAMPVHAADPTQFQRWGQQINSAPKHHQSKAEISRILGRAPDKCEKIPGKPTVGMLFRHDSGTTILKVYPDSPAAGTGIKAGDKILSINSKPVHSMEDIIASTEGLEGPNPTIKIKTQRGTYTVTPRFSTSSEQCLWEIIPERQVPNGAGATEGIVSQQRFFRATCRFTNGEAYICHVRWHE